MSRRRISQNMKDTVARTSQQYRYIITPPKARSGQAVIEGTRIGVHDVVGLLRNGENVGPAT